MLRIILTVPDHTTWVLVDTFYVILIRIVIYISISNCFSLSSSCLFTINNRKIWNWFCVLLRQYWSSMNQLNSRRMMLSRLDGHIIFCYTFRNQFCKFYLHVIRHINPSKSYLHFGCFAGDAVLYSRLCLIVITVFRRLISFIK